MLQIIHESRRRRLDQCYNAQAVVATDSMLVVATEVTQAANDSIIKSVMGYRQCLLRGIKNVKGECKHQPPTLIVWGKGDFVFTPADAEAYRKDLKHVELHMLNAGHFALETKLTRRKLQAEFSVFWHCENNRTSQSADPPLTM